MKTWPFLILLVLSEPLFAVDINTASAPELARELSGIGPVKAQRIIEYREKIGGFRSVEQLIEVKGIGPKTLDHNRDKIEISAAPRPNTRGDSLSLKVPQPGTPRPPSRGGSLPKGERGSNKSATDVSLDLSPSIEKPPSLRHNLLWDALIIVPLFIVCLFIFVAAWFKSARKDEPVLREHMVSTAFVCSGCGKVSGFQNVCYEGHLGDQYVDGNLPPGWSCIPNWLGKPCDYCFDCSQKVHPDNVG